MREGAETATTMTVLGVVANSLIAFGPIACLAIFLVAQRSHLSIISVVGAFFEHVEFTCGGRTSRWMSSEVGSG